MDPQQPPGNQTPDYWQSGNSSSGSTKTKKLLWILVGLGIIFIISVMAAVLLSSGEEQATQEEVVEQTLKDAGIDPANAVSIEQINNSITQDISGLNEETDFAPGRLDDQTLGL